MHFYESILLAGSETYSANTDSDSLDSDLIEEYKRLFATEGHDFTIPTPHHEHKMLLSFSTDEDEGDNDPLCLGTDVAMAMLSCTSNDTGTTIPLTMMTLLTGKQGFLPKREYRYILDIQSSVHHPRFTSFESAYDFFGIKQRPAAIILMDYWSINANQDSLKETCGINRVIAAAWFEYLKEQSGRDHD